MAQGVVELALCRALGALGFAESVAAQCLLGAGGAEKVRQGVLEGLGHAGFGLSVEQGCLVGDLVLALEAEQSCLGDGDIEGVAGGAGGWLEVEVLDAEAGAELAAASTRIVSLLTSTDTTDTSAMDGNSNSSSRRTTSSTIPNCQVPEVTTDHF
ncbi:hypothetical protein [Streptomyces anulatus]|uniref:hypothetical protein n=1 Tax=Streptomyces anulatus TaxID=1892 RepID=UPI00386F4937